MELQAKEPLGSLDTLDSCLSLPFHVFALVCDRDRNPSPRAALRFQAIVAARRRRHSAPFHDMLGFCGEQYQTVWRAYAASPDLVTPHRFRDLLVRQKDQLTPAEFGRLKQDLAWLAQRLYKAGFALVPRRDQRAAFVDFLTILREDPPVPHADLRAEERLPDAPGGAHRGDSRGTQAQGAPPALDPAVDLAPEQRAAAFSDRASSAPRPNGLSEPAEPETRKIGMPQMPRPDAAWMRGSLKLVCVKVIDEARDVRTFSFAPCQSAWFCYQPGQFLTIEPVIDGRIVPRPYTISSSPTRPGLLEITVKRAPGGLVSNWLHDTMQPGHTLAARGPFGNFTCLNFRRDKYLFLSAGSGITPLMSMLRYLHDLAAPADVVFFHSAGTQDDLVFRKELGFYRERNASVRVHFSLTGDTPEGAWDGLRGRLDNGMLHQIAPDFMERVVLACGPPGFMDKAKQLLAGNGFPLDAQFDEESFVPKSARPAEGRTGNGPARKSTVVFVRSSKRVEISADDTILDAATRCNIDIPSACRQGRCGTCRATKLSGDVLMPGQEALSPEEIAQGEILTCVGQPASPIVEVEA